MQKAISTLVGMLTAAAVLPSHAAGLQVSPTSLSLPAKQRGGIFTLGNKGTEPLTAQVRVFRWTQDANGGEILEPTDVWLRILPLQGHRRQSRHWPDPQVPSGPRNASSIGLESSPISPRLSQSLPK